ncbi:MAG: 30S ribosomal protein S20 [Chlamydiia bacterium]|nr:30S ribosomal protein S20 [Chlamydiia bacterium]
MAKEEVKKKVKTRTAEKRNLQNEKRRLINKSFKSQTRTVVRHFEEALKSRDRGTIDERLRSVYSYMDQGVKRGIYKLGKASRIKARATAKVTKQFS